jgi:hypothetical protein
VEQATRDDIAAAAAAHQELGRDFDGAVAEGLVDRIGAEIDKRIDARLGASPRRSHSPAEIAQSGKHQAFWTGTESAQASPASQPFWLTTMAVAQQR